MPDPFIFSGRLIFDHLAKTAGQAVNRWLRTTLGEGCVSDNMQGGHRQLIQQYGGTYSVISAHLSFENAGLDPRYHYATCVREPVARCLSWLYFVTNNIHHEDVPYWHTLKRYLDSEGEDFNPAAPPFEPNTYVTHFAELSPSLRMSDQQKLDFTLDVLRDYCVIGTYEALPAFIRRLAGLIGVPGDVPLLPVNTTRDRPAMTALPEALLRRIREVNAVDLEFYARFREMCEARERAGPQKPLSQLAPRPAPADWRLLPDAPRLVVAEGIDVLDASVTPEQVTGRGSVEVRATFATAGRIQVPALGVQIIDAFGKCLSAVNTLDVGTCPGPIQPGSFTFRHFFVADLPAGAYQVWLTLGDAFDRSQLARCEVLGRFEVRVPQLGHAPSPVPLASRQHLDGGDSYVPRALAAGDIALTLPPPSSVHFAGHEARLSLHLRNVSADPWRASLTRRLSLRLSWQDADGVSLGTQAFPFTGELPPGEDVPVDLYMTSPEAAGTYHLVVDMEAERAGHAPLPLAQAACALSILSRDRWALDARHTDYARSLIGQREDRRIVTTGTEGFVVYGPYLPLPPGRYRIRLLGTVTVAGEAWAEAAHRTGTRILHHAALAAQPAQEENVLHAFDLLIGADEDVRDLEIRLWACAETVLAWEGVTLAPLEDAAPEAEAPEAEIPEAEATA